MFCRPVKSKMVLEGTLGNGMLVGKPAAGKLEKDHTQSKVSNVAITDKAEFSASQTVQSCNSTISGNRESLNSEKKEQTVCQRLFLVDVKCRICNRNSIVPTAGIEPVLCKGCYTVLCHRRIGSLEATIDKAHIESRNAFYMHLECPICLECSTIMQCDKDVYCEQCNIILFYAGTLHRSLNTVSERRGFLM